MIDKELNEAVSKGLNMGKKRRRKKRTIRVGVCFLLIFSFIGAGINPTFAEYIKKLPLISSLYAETESIDEAKKCGMVQYVNKSVEDNGIKVTIDSIQLYGERWSIEYTIEDMKGDREFNERKADFDIKRIQAEWNNSKGVDSQSIGSNGNLNQDYRGFYNQDMISSDNNKIKRKFDLKTNAYLNKNNKVPDKLKLEFKGIKCYSIDLGITKYDGEWNMEIDVDKEKFDIQPIVLVKDKVIDINGLKFNVDVLESFPTYTKMVLNEKSLVELNELKLDDIKGVKLISGDKDFDLIKINYKDKVLLDNGIISRAKKIELYFKSIYFDDIKELNLIGDGGILSSRSEIFIEYDVNDNKLYSQELNYSLESGLENKIGRLFVNDDNEKEVFSLGLSSEIPYIPEFFDRRYLDNRYAMIDFIIDDNGNIYDWGYKGKEVSDKLYYNIEFVWRGEKGSINDNGQLSKEIKIYNEKDFVNPNKLFIYMNNPIKDVLGSFKVKVY